MTKQKLDDAFVTIHKNALLELIHWSRRYCDGRSTFAPSTFNTLYNHLKAKIPEVMIEDRPDDVVKFWPYAQDGMYDEKTGSFDARKL